MPGTQHAVLCHPVCASWCKQRVASPWDSQGGRHWHLRAPRWRPSVSPGLVVSSSTGASVQCRRCPAGPAGHAPSRRSGCSATWGPPWPRLCRSCRSASGARNLPTSDVSACAPLTGDASLLFLFLATHSALRSVLHLSLLGPEPRPCPTHTSETTPDGG